MDTKSRAQVVKPSPVEIAAAAYYLWEKEGRIHGRDTEHWLRAEAQLMASRSCGNTGGCEPKPQNITDAAAQSLRQRRPPSRQNSRSGRHAVVKPVV